MYTDQKETFFQVSEVQNEEFLPETDEDERIEEQDIPEHAEDSPEPVNDVSEVNVEVELREMSENEEVVADESLPDSEESDKDDATEVITNSKKYILKTYKCALCNLKFGGKKTFQNHECKVDEMKCKVCKKEFSDLRTFRKHVNMAHQTNKNIKKRKCPMCKVVSNI